MPAGIVYTAMVATPVTRAVMKYTDGYSMVKGSNPKMTEEELKLIWEQLVGLLLILIQANASNQLIANASLAVNIVERELNKK